MSLASYDPSFRGYLRVLRRLPGYRLRVASAAAFSTGTLVRDGVVTLLVCMAIAAAFLVLVCYPAWRRRGPESRLWGKTGRSLLRDVPPAPPLGGDR